MCSYLCVVLSSSCLPQFVRPLSAVPCCCNVNRIEACAPAPMSVPQKAVIHPAYRTTFAGLIFLLLSRFISSTSSPFSSKSLSSSFPFLPYSSRIASILFQSSFSLSLSLSTPDLTLRFSRCTGEASLRPTDNVDLLKMMVLTKGLDYRIIGGVMSSNATNRGSSLIA